MGDGTKLNWIWLPDVRVNMSGHYTGTETGVSLKTGTEYSMEVIYSGSHQDFDFRDNNT